MKIVFHSYYDKYNDDNLLFKKSNAEIGDDLLSPFLSIAEKAKEKEIFVCTSFNIQFNEIDAIVFVELPKQSDPFYIESVKSGKPLFLITLESPIIMPENYMISNHSKFKKVFTWSDELLGTNDNKYIKINYSFNFPINIPFSLKESKKLMTLISGNKNSNFSNELYSSRKNVINYMEKNHPEEFDFYGLGWDFFVLGNSLLERVVNKLKIPLKIFNKQYRTYKGSVLRKNAVLKKYSFSLCYENVKDIPGYITEKIFDSFFAGCVPIYLGADNIDKYIPNDCFIDRRDFDSFEDVYLYIKSMSEQDYQKYLTNIQKFIDSKIDNQFSNNNFSNTLLKGILDEIITVNNSYDRE
ncbi:glycosyltransferase family 10 domain-containing protein [Flavobacterium sp. ZB4R12]|uniref:glycosyltransferase family 10 domain-containing protein n=1 Tax=Flavobacterium sp. ZB4R12 TaxID=3398732 RepID=UPI003AAA7C5C